MLSKLAFGIRFYLGFAPSFGRWGYERTGLAEKPINADFSGQTWLVTGASGGIGRQIAKQAANAGARVLAVARRPEPLDSLRDEITGSGMIEPLICDLSLLADIRRMLDEWGPDLRIDVLVNNVGVLLNQHQVTNEGLEASFATNLLGHYVLTNALLDSGSFNPDSLVINMSSGGMYSESLQPDRLNETDPNRFDGVQAYARHKRAQVVLTRLWNQQRGESVGFHVMHPGWVDTHGVKTALPGFRKAFAAILRNADQGADTALWLVAARPKVENEGIWLDRQLQPEHAAGSTRVDAATEQRLLSVLKEIAQA